MASVHHGLNQEGSIPHGLSPPGLSPPGLNPPGLSPSGTVPDAEGLVSCNINMIFNKFSRYSRKEFLVPSQMSPFLEHWNDAPVRIRLVFYLQCNWQWVRLGKGTKNNPTPSSGQVGHFSSLGIKSKTFSIFFVLLDLTMEQEYSILQLVILQVLPLRLL